MTQEQIKVNRTRVSGDVFVTLHCNDEMNCFDIDSKHILLDLPEGMTDSQIDAAVEGAMLGVLRSIVDVEWDGDDVRQFVHYCDGGKKDCYLLGSFADDAEKEETNDEEED